jgi:hypothetical protein
MTVKAVWHIVKESAKSIGVAKLAPHDLRRYAACGIGDGPAPGCATHREASWSRSSFSWGTFQCRRPSATLVASSGFDQPSMIALASSLILELRGGQFWKVSR